MNARARVLISGRVQGVFFRSEILYKAKKCDVTGWVCNLPDGRVEAIFEGEEENVEKLIEFCIHGPRGAKVSSVDVTWENYVDEFRDFIVKY